VAVPGVADAKTVPVLSDVFGIAARLREIDPGYFVCMRRSDGAFEVHHTQSAKSYQLTLPYNTLDARAVEWVRRTSVQHAARLMDEVERHNDRLEG